MPSSGCCLGSRPWFPSLATTFAATAATRLSIFARRRFGTTDILRTYQLHANCYIVKTVDPTRFMAVVQAIESFRLALVMLPSRE